MSILLYADDILLIAPSITSLRQLLNICEQELEWLDMSLNAFINGTFRKIFNTRSQETVDVS